MLDLDEVYEKISVNDLKPQDRQKIDVLSECQNTVLSEKTVQDYLEQNVTGNSLRAVYGDILGEFIAYLREQPEYFKIDKILEYHEDGKDDNDK